MAQQVEGRQSSMVLEGEQAASKTVEQKEHKRIPVETEEVEEVTESQ